MLASEKTSDQARRRLGSKINPGIKIGIKKALQVIV